MCSKLVTSLLVAENVAKSRRRPCTSDDNPNSESKFNTMKYRPDFPERDSIIQAYLGDNHK